MSRETMVWGAAAKSLVGQGIHEGEVYNNKQLIERRAEKLKCVLRRERGKKKQEYIPALENANKSLLLAQQIGDKEDIKNAYEILSQIY